MHLSCGKYEVNTITDGFPGRSTRHGGLGWCTVTLLRSEDHVVVVDTGTMSMRPVILQRLEALGVDPNDVTDLLLTHSHHDHSINWVAFRNARVVIGRTELAWSLEQQAGRTMVPELYMQALRDSARLHPTTDGQEVAPGIFSRATPGHTPGHMTYVVEGPEHDVLLAGDAVKNRAELISRCADMTCCPRDSAVSFDAVWSWWSWRTGSVLIPGHDLPLILDGGVCRYLGSRSAAISAWFGDDLASRTIIDLTTIQ